MNTNCSFNAKMTIPLKLKWVFHKIFNGIVKRLKLFSQSCLMLFHLHNVISLNFAIKAKFEPGIGKYILKFRTPEKKFGFTMLTNCQNLSAQLFTCLHYLKVVYKIAFPIEDLGVLWTLDHRYAERPMSSPRRNVSK